MSLSAGPAFFLGAAGSACAHVSHLSQYVVVLARKASYESHCHSLQTCDRQSIKRHFFLSQTSHMRTNHSA